MKTPKVRLYVRIRRADGRDAYADPVWNRNRTLRAGYTLINGQQEHHPEACYYLRYLRSGKRVWQSVGSDPDAAIVKLRNTQHDLEALSLGRTADLAVSAVVVPGADQETSCSLAEACHTYLQEVRQFRAPKTIAGCENMLRRFLARFPNRRVDEVTRKDLLAHMAALKGEGLGDRSVANHIARINTLLRANGVTGLLRPTDKPRYDEKEVRAYNADELRVLLAAANPEERILFQFFLGTGFREQEVMCSSWRNIDFNSKVISVRSRPEMGFRLKDKQERSVPVPDSLIDALTERKLDSSSMLVFPAANGSPNGHFLRMIKGLALRAGLNCGDCVSKGGRSCAAHPVCRRWVLHSLRRTFATLHSEAGVSPRTIQRWLGHEDLATTLRYLAVADIRSARTRTQVNGTFAALRFGCAL